MTVIKTTGRAGAMSVEIEGLSDIVKRLRSTGIRVWSDTEFQMLKLGTYFQEEVSESIAGNRAEIKSVDTGNFLKSIKLDVIEGKKTECGVKIYPQAISYPNSNVTTAEVAKILEFGTSKNPTPRLHFNNTLKRNEKKITGDIKVSVTKSVNKF